MTEINADVAIKEAIAYIQLTQEFQTLDDASGAPVAVSFIFPREQSSAISKLDITLDDKTIRMDIKSMDFGQDYDDIDDPDKFVVIDKESYYQEYNMIPLGNVLPGKKVKAEIHII